MCRRGIYCRTFSENPRTREKAATIVSMVLYCIVSIVLYCKYCIVSIVLYCIVKAWQTCVLLYAHFKTSQQLEIEEK